MAVDRLNRGESSVALAKELGVHRRLLYKWRDQLALADPAQGPPPANARDPTAGGVRTSGQLGDHGCWSDDEVFQASGDQSGGENGVTGTHPSEAKEAV